MLTVLIGELCFCWVCAGQSANNSGRFPVVTVKYFTGIFSANKFTACSLLVTFLSNNAGEDQKG